MTSNSKVRLITWGFWVLFALVVLSVVASPNGSANRTPTHEGQGRLGGFASPLRQATNSVRPGVGPLEISTGNLEVWGTYKIRPMLFPAEEWEFFVVVVPAGTESQDLGRLAREFFVKYPKTRVRFFSDKRYIQQYVDRDRFFNDQSGGIPEVPFPDENWVRTHFLGNINNRSSIHARRWMLEDRYGSVLSFLP